MVVHCVQVFQWKSGVSGASVLNHVAMGLSSGPEDALLEAMFVRVRARHACNTHDCNPEPNLKGS